MSTNNSPSPRWYIVLMSSLMIVGVLLIVLNYLTLLPGSVSRWYLWSGLGLIGAGFLMTTNSVSKFHLKDLHRVIHLKYRLQFHLYQNFLLFLKIHPFRHCY